MASQSDSSSNQAQNTGSDQPQDGQAQSSIRDEQKEIVLPDEASDTDLIEKEWVDKAKEIVEHTQDDPYEQQKALSAMKTDYMKKRYNRELKEDD